MTGPRLENRLPDEAIGSPDEHPLREAAWVVGAGLGLVTVVALLLGWGAGWLAPRLPFAVEVDLAERLVDRPVPAGQAARTAALQAHADRVAAAMGLPADLRVVVSVDDAPVVNAFATVGGRIRLYRGLVERLPSEDALTALLAHEIAHVRHRDVAASAGRGLAVAVVLSALSADTGASVARAVLDPAAGLALKRHSRERERAADLEALRAVVTLHGHAGGVIALLQVLAAAQPDDGAPDGLRTHPATAERLAALTAEARRQGWALEGASRPLDAAVRWDRRNPG